MHVYVSASEYECRQRPEDGVAVAGWVLGSELWSFIRTSNVPNCWAIPPVPKLCVLWALTWQHISHVIWVVARTQVLKCGVTSLVTCVHMVYPQHIGTLCLDLDPSLKMSHSLSIYMQTHILTSGKIWNSMLLLSNTVDKSCSIPV